VRLAVTVPVKAEKQPAAARQTAALQAAQPVLQLITGIVITSLPVVAPAVHGARQALLLIHVIQAGAPVLFAILPAFIAVIPSLHALAPEAAGAAAAQALGVLPVRVLSVQFLRSTTVMTRQHALVQAATGVPVLPAEAVGVRLRRAPFAIQLI